MLAWSWEVRNWPRKFFAKFASTANLSIQISGLPLRPPKEEPDLDIYELLGLYHIITPNSQITSVISPNQAWGASS